MRIHGAPPSPHKPLSPCPPPRAPSNCAPKGGPIPFTSIAEFEATENPTEAELALIAACKAGDECFLPNGTEPDAATLPPESPITPDRHIRAELLRLLIMGGTPACGLHPIGVCLEGAQITGTLDLQFTKSRGRAVLEKCRFSNAPQLDQAEIAQLSFDDSHLPGLSAQNIRVEGSLFLRRLTTTGTVRVNSAKIGAQLSCTGATLNVAGQMALNAQGAQVGGGLILRGLTATGTVDVNSAKIDGQLDCEGATLNGLGQKALNAQAMQVKQAFIFRRMKSVSGEVDLTSAHVGALSDDARKWPQGTDLLGLNGFTYDRITSGPLTLADRAEWLATGSRFKGTFRPQPYTQFARVLRDMGHAAEARKVLMERDRLIFAESHETNLVALLVARSENKGDVEKAWLRHRLPLLWDWFSFMASGYGHAPQRALKVALFCIGSGAVLFFLAWHAGVMVPNSAIVLTSPEWLAAMAITPDAPAQAWTAMQPGTHYETFYSLPYALDVFVPFVSLGQEQAWAATTTTGFGIFVRWFTFAYQIAGWAITALGIAAVTGFVQKNQPD